MAQNTPSLSDVMSRHFDYQTSSMYTAIPAIVVSIKNLGEQRIDVQPTVNVRDVEGIVVSERPPILNVPLHMPITKQGGLTYPISTGTSVFLVFSMRGLETWKRSNGYPTTPPDVRKFDIRDCVAIPGIYPFGEAQNAPSKRSHSHSTDDVVLVHNIGSVNEVEIRLKPNGNVIVNSPTKVEVNCVDAEVNADSSAVINTDQMEVNCSDMNVNGNFKATSGEFLVNAGTFGITADSGATMNAAIDMQGSFKLNGTTIEDHTHAGVVSGGDRTDEFGN